MKKTFLFFAIILMNGILFAQKITPDVEKRAEDLLKQMTLEEKIDYIGGYNAFFIRAIPRLGIPQIRMADGPQGVRNNTMSTLYPSGITTTSTWNRDLMYKVGEGIGLDCRARGVNIILGPGVNIYRYPLCGRNFEYFGEDPYLASETAVQYIKGVQDQHVMATIKHFAANNQEFDRHHTSSDIDVRTLHEVYLPTFRKAVQKANVGAVMDGYHLINGVHASENKYLNIDVLRNMWGFKGILMSDWVSVYSAVGPANGGLDLEMPGGDNMNYKNLIGPIKNGIVTEKTIDEKVRHILQTLIAFGFLDRPQQDNTVPEHNPYTENIALEIAKEAIVLLKNENNVLPLKGKTLVLGPNANEAPTGGGSGLVNPYKTVSLYNGMKNVAKKNQVDFMVDPNLSADLTQFGEFYVSKGSAVKGFKGQYFLNKTLSGNPEFERIDTTINFNWFEGGPKAGFPVDNFSTRWTGVFRPKTTGKYKIRLACDDGYRMFFDGKEVISFWSDHGMENRDIVVSVEAKKEYPVVIEYYESGSDAGAVLSYSKFNDENLDEKLKGVKNIVVNVGFNSNLESEGFDRRYKIPQEQLDLIDRLSKTGKNLIVVLNAGGSVEMESWKDKAKAIVMAWYPGQMGGQALAEILTGKISPSGKLPISIEKKLEDNPAHDFYYPLDPKAIHKRVQYGEGIFGGYKGYDRSGVEPLFPFGFGLSYSTFDYSNLKLEKLGGNKVKVSFTIKNTGKVDAAEAAQIYVGDVEASVPRPKKELKGFEKVQLKKGESKEVSVVLDDEAFSFFDVNTNKFVVEPGEFNIMIGSSSKDIRLSDKVSL